MAKKRKNPFEDDPVLLSGNDMMETQMEFRQDLTQLAPLLGRLSDEEGIMIFTVMGELIEMGITPDKYEVFYNAYKKLLPLMEQAGIETRPKHKSTRGKQKAPSKKGWVRDNSIGETLLLKIQMKDVTKPPMWREVDVPANRTFLDLHEIIQCVMGFHNSHLWRFGSQAYGGFQIGIKSKDEFHPGLDYVDADAATTPISSYLDKVGAELTYVYDFGDDWTFTVTVKKVLDKKMDHPVCTAFKSELNPIEDSGGFWSYIDMRYALANWNQLSDEQKEDLAGRGWYDEPEDYYEMLKDSVFNIDKVNESLKKY